MIIPCLKAERGCFPCEGDSSNPLANLSIEPFDLNIWLNVYFGSVTNVTPNSWRRDTCVGFCESSISQIDADDCARRRALECIPEPPLPPIPPQPPTPPPPQQPVFCNQEVSCQSGADCYTIPACTIFSNSQADANAIARSLCEARVNDSSLSSPCSGGGNGGGGGGTPNPPPAVPCFECCNCGVMVQIENYTPEFFVFDPTLLDVNDSTDACNILPTSETRNLSGKAVNIPDNGWDFCTGEDRTELFFFKQFGSWFNMADAGFCVPLIDGKVFTKPLEAYPAGEPFDGLVTLKHYPYDLGFGTGAWDGKFTLTDDSFTTCAVQRFATKHINGLGGFIIQLDQSGSGPSAVWTLTVRCCYFADEFSPSGCSNTPIINWWIGEHVGENQCGTYNKTGGDFFTGPANLNLVGVE